MNENQNEIVPPAFPPLPVPPADSDPAYNSLSDFLTQLDQFSISALEKRRENIEHVAAFVEAAHQWIHQENRRLPIQDYRAFFIAQFREASKTLSYKQIYKLKLIYQSLSETNRDGLAGMIEGLFSNNLVAAKFEMEADALGISLAEREDYVADAQARIERPQTFFYYLQTEGISAENVITRGLSVCYALSLSIQEGAAPASLTLQAGLDTEIDMALLPLPELHVSVKERLVFIARDLVSVSADNPTKARSLLQILGILQGALGETGGVSSTTNRNRLLEFIEIIAVTLMKLMVTIIQEEHDAARELLVSVIEKIGNVFLQQRGLRSIEIKNQLSDFLLSPTINNVIVRDILALVRKKAPSQEYLAKLADSALQKLLTDQSLNAEEQNALKYICLPHLKLSSALTFFPDIFIDSATLKEDVPRYIFAFLAYQAGEAKKVKEKGLVPIQSDFLTQVFSAGASFLLTIPLHYLALIYNIQSPAIKTLIEDFLRGMPEEDTLTGFQRRLWLCSTPEAFMSVWDAGHMYAQQLLKEKEGIYFLCQVLIKIAPSQWQRRGRPGVPPLTQEEEAQGMELEEEPTPLPDAIDNLVEVVHKHINLMGKIQEVENAFNRGEIPSTLDSLLAAMEDKAQAAYAIKHIPWGVIERTVKEFFMHYSFAEILAEKNHEELLRLFSYRYVDPVSHDFQATVERGEAIDITKNRIILFLLAWFYPSCLRRIFAEPNLFREFNGYLFSLLYDKYALTLEDFAETVKAYLASNAQYKVLKDLLDQYTFLQQPVSTFLFEKTDQAIKVLAAVTKAIEMACKQQKILDQWLLLTWINCYACLREKEYQIYNAYRPEDAKINAQLKLDILQLKKAFLSALIEVIRTEKISFTALLTNATFNRMREESVKGNRSYSLEFIILSAVSDFSGEAEGRAFAFQLGQLLLDQGKTPESRKIYAILGKRECIGEMRAPNSRNNLQAEAALILKLLYNNRIRNFLIAPDDSLANLFSIFFTLINPHPDLIRQIFESEFSNLLPSLDFFNVLPPLDILLNQLATNFNRQPNLLIDYLINNKNVFSPELAEAFSKKFLGTGEAIDLILRASLPKLQNFISIYYFLFEQLRNQAGSDTFVDLTLRDVYQNRQPTEKEKLQLLFAVLDDLNKTFMTTVNATLSLNTSEPTDAVRWVQDVIVGIYHHSNDESSMKQRIARTFSGQEWFEKKRASMPPLLPVAAGVARQEAIVETDMRKAFEKLLFTESFMITPKSSVTGALQFAGMFSASRSPGGIPVSEGRRPVTPPESPRPASPACTFS